MCVCVCAPVSVPVPVCERDVQCRDRSDEFGFLRNKSGFSSFRPTSKVVSLDHSSVEDITITVGISSVCQWRKLHNNHSISGHGAKDLKKNI